MIYTEELNVFEMSGMGAEQNAKREISKNREVDIWWL
jgi:hypothetical protein